MEHTERPPLNLSEIIFPELNEPFENPEKFPKAPEATWNAFTRFEISLKLSETLIS